VLNQKRVRTASVVVANVIDEMEDQTAFLEALADIRENEGFPTRTLREYIEWQRTVQARLESTLETDWRLIIGRVPPHVQEIAASVFTMMTFLGAA
jgi:hypothetical protein